MNQRKSRNPIVSLAMLKGKPSTLSVPSIRFNTGEEDLEEVPVDDYYSDESAVLKPVVEFSIGDIDNAKERRPTLTSSSSADATKELSPAKEVTQKFNKRSSSLDSTSSTESINNDAWGSLFHDLKGKITKTVEETLHIDLRSNGGSSSGTAVAEKPLDEEESSSVVPCSGNEENDKNAFDPEIAEEVVVESDDQIEAASKSLAANKTIMMANIPSSSSEKLQTVPSELRQRRTKFLSKGDEPSMTMSFLATKSVNEDVFEEELHNEYVREIQHEDIKKPISDEEVDKVIESEKGRELPEVKECDIINKINALPLVKVSTPRKWHLEQKRIIYVLLTLAYLFIPIPSYLSGFILGVVITVVIMKFYYKLTIPVVPKQPIVSSTLSSSLPFKASVIPNKNIKIVYKGWMNQLRQQYDPMDYHVTQTYSVFVRLEGNMLRISLPRAKIPKHASFKESLHETSFYDQKYYNLSGCKITLLPEGLIKKRLWSRKYPICIVLNETAYKQDQMHSETQTGNDAEKESDVVYQHSFDNIQEDYLYLFTRTNRDKEEWYWRFKSATKIKDERITETKSAPSSPKHSITNQNEYMSNMLFHDSFNGIGNLQSSSVNSGSVPDVSQLTQEAHEKIISEISSLECPINFDTYMKRLLPSLNVSAESDNLINILPKENIRSSPKKDLPIKESDMSWLNVFIGRSFWDFLREDYWINLMTMKIQKKLSKIKVPYFMEELVISDLEFGNQMPVIKGVSSPEMDDRGLWIDLDVTYGGIFKMTLETKLNLLKLKKDTEMKEMKDISEQRSPRMAVFDSEEEDSAESSSENEGTSEFVESQNEESSSNVTSIPAKSGTSKKLLRIVDKITQSRYFQHATENKYLRRAVQEVSNTRLILTIEVHNVNGIVALNIPPPPTDRLWYGFKYNPQVTLVAKPRLGEREVTVSSVTEWIEKKLIQEFQKIFVIPNMDDLIIPFMSSGIHSTPTQMSSAQASPNHAA